MRDTSIVFSLAVLVCLSMATDSVASPTPGNATTPAPTAPVPEETPVVETTCARDSQEYTRCLASFSDSVASSGDIMCQNVASKIQSFAECTKRVDCCGPYDELWAEYGATWTNMCPGVTVPYCNKTHPIAAVWHDPIPPQEAVSDHGFSCDKDMDGFEGCYNTFSVLVKNSGGGGACLKLRNGINGLHGCAQNIGCCGAYNSAMESMAPLFSDGYCPDATFPACVDTTTYPVAPTPPAITDIPSINTKKLLGPTLMQPKMVETVSPATVAEPEPATPEADPTDIEKDDTGYAAAHTSGWTQNTVCFTCTMLAVLHMKHTMR